jgi:hypothetical protein
MPVIGQSRNHYATITNERIVLSVIGLSLSGLIVLAAGLTPNAAFAERIPFVIQNETQSIPAPLGFEQYFQLAILLPPRNDSKIYSGTLTYTSSLPVEVNILQPKKNETLSSSSQGLVSPPFTVPGLNYSLSVPNILQPQSFDTVQFVGSSVSLLQRSPQPFSVSYSIDGELLDPQPLPK